MKKRIVILLGAALVTVAYADYNPIPLTPGSFTADVVVEKTAPPPLNNLVTATMDGGTNNNANTWYEQGFNTNMPSTGIPPAGAVFTAQGSATHQFRMPASYAANNALFINSQIPTGTLTLTTPTVLSGLALLGASGNGAIGLTARVHYLDGSSEDASITCPDWFGGANVAWTANGRLNLDNLQFGNIYDNNPRIYYVDFPVYGTSPVTSVDFTWTSGGGRSCLMGLSGLAPTGTDYTPLAVTGFTRDMVIEAAAPHVYGSLFTATTATMDGGTNNQSNTWNERGLNTGTLTSGLPTAGSTFTASGDANHSFKMPASYVGDNALFIAATLTTGTLTLTTPTTLTGLSFLSSCGGGAIPLNLTIYHQDGSSENATVTSPDWFDTTAASTGWNSNGRFDNNSASFNDVNNATQLPRLHFKDVALTIPGSPVTRIDFAYGGSGGRCSIFALSGQTTAGGAYTPLAISGFNKDMVVENVSPVTRYTQPAWLNGYTTVSMDGGTNNTGNTWYERGYYALQPNSGLPAPGTSITSLDLPDHHYQMPTNYAGNNAIYVDRTHPVANVTPTTPAWYSALSFLSATANNSVTNQCIMQYSNGTSETNLFVSRDWFNVTPYAFSALGRVNLNNQTINNDAGRTTTPNPRLYEAQFALNAPPGVLLTNVLLTWVGAINTNTARMVVLAVSGTTGAVAPIIREQPVGLTTMEGSNVVLSATMGGGTPPFTYQWQILSGGGYVNVVNGGHISGANTPILSFTNIVWTNAGSYRFLASGPSLTTTSAVATITVYSGLPDVTQPSDAIVVYQPNGGTAPPAAEGVEHAIDNLTSKYFNNGNGLTPFGGPAGFEVTPAVGGTIVSVLRFYTANDATERDPADYLLEGSRDGGATYTTIASGTLTLPDGRNAAALALNPFTLPMLEVRITNTSGYTKYRVSSATTKAATSMMQIGEVELLGVVDPNSVPTVLVAPVNTSANEGAKATFSVTAIGPGTLGYRWYDVTAGDPGTVIPGQNTATLTLTGVTATMNGNTYRVAVTNQFGAVISPTLANPGAQLTVVSGAPVIQTDIPTEGLVYLGRTAVLPVTISGTEPFTMQWQKNGTNLTDTSRISGSRSNVLSIARAQLSDAGSYQLATIHNTYGDAQSTVEALIVQTIPALTDNGVGWALNGIPSPPVVSGGVLGLTVGAGNSSRSAWYQFPLYVGAFQASFLYQDIGGGGADGIAFALQNDARGLTALGGGGGGLGYLGITNSVALQFNIYGTAGIAFNTNGATGGYETNTAPVNISGGEPIKVGITYAAGVMHLVLSNTVTAGTFTTTLPVGSLPARLGADTAYVGFTGADGGAVSTQNISEFTYIPQPIMTAQAVGGTVVLAWPASVGGYTLQSSGSLATPNWGDAGLPVTVVGNQYQATVTNPAGYKFYRLVINP